ncbi:hypothetical protein UCRPA7_179 [Phaeoacremonium minimum UCRPA7]|uniref:Uncharacterized protein n=1 Tax=Phaeoacremonium minimum (strain UCR-PA7) TaxID=1286976 RepID=R8BY56_PHAM7|nr:hypothetical protein UCRPA7_179 [Phaeoacremonium minimum UCRPA7]EOO04272.1 hypothetical protein UCRPA7_179 [Phaeoacremonium minimum UCRPA7]
MVNWDEKALADLAKAFFAVTGSSLSQEQKDSIVHKIESYGHEINWDRIRWDDIKGDLFEAVYTVLKPSLNKDEQDAIVNFMKARGHDMTWIAIRTEWSEKAHLDLLLAVLAEITPTQPEWDRIVTKHLKPKGYNYTQSAALQHLQKIRRKEGKDGADASAPATPATPATPSTPASAGKNPKRANGNASRSTGKRKAQATATPTNFQDDDEVINTPSKKAKIKDDGMDDNIKAEV